MDIKDKDQKKNKDIDKNEINDEEYLNYNKVASATDSTGVIPATPGSEDEKEFYTDIYSIPKKEDTLKKEKEREKKDH